MHCAASATADTMRWFEAIDGVARMCHAWWPPGLFYSDTGVPQRADVEQLLSRLTVFIQTVQSSRMLEEMGVLSFLHQ
jgi:hypothetical protein